MRSETVHSEQDYRLLLREELERRCQHNPRYSLRAMARDLGFAPARLSDVLRGRYGLSRDAAGAIGKRLGWSQEECAYFCDLVDAAHARRKTEKSEAQKRLKDSQVQGRQLSLDRFRLIADWYHYGILELLQTDGHQKNSKWIGKTLGLGSEVVAAAIKRLQRLSLLSLSDDELNPEHPFLFTPSDVPSGALRKHHQQLLDKAQRALHGQSVEERDFSSLVLAVDSSNMKEAKQMIKDFRRKFNEKFGPGRRRDSVYCLSVQFFRLNEKPIKRSTNVVN